MSEKTKFVSDDKITLKIDGLRYVSLRRSNMSSIKISAQLEFGYKGHNGSIWYDDENECERMYKKVVAALEG